MGSEERQPTTPDQGQSKDSRYQPALTYVALDRAHRKRSRWSTVLAISVAVLVASLVMLGVIGFSYMQGQTKNARMAEHANLVAIEKEFKEENFRIDWDALRAVNPDTVGWLYVPGTSINYPVVRGVDNDYYLTHDFTREQGWLAQFGSIFLDWRNNPNWTDQAYFIYGHHMNDGSMFADIARLSDQSRFDASRTVYLLSPNGNFKLRSFALIHCASDDPLVQISFSSAGDFASYVQDKMNRSIVYAGGVPSAADIHKSFAFATCDNYSSGRYVLYAYVEQELGFKANDASNAAVRSGGAAGVADDLPADAADAASVGAGLGVAATVANEAGEQQEANPEESYPEEEYSEDEYYDEYYEEGYYGGDSDQASDETESVIVGDNGQYAGGYYVYDENGDLRWVPTE
ncbi:MAG: class B sortase [Eggerthellaceae bacterium]|nr:class B sortase [Eggerthellaceae bacterium]